MRVAASYRAGRHLLPGQQVFEAWIAPEYREGGIDPQEAW